MNSKKYSRSDETKLTIKASENKPWDYQLGSSIRSNNSKMKHVVKIKHCKGEVKGSIDDYKFESVNRKVIIPSEFWKLKITQVQDIPFLEIPPEGENENFHGNYKLYFATNIPRMLKAFITMDSLPEFSSEELARKYLETFKHHLSTRHVLRTISPDEQKEQSFLPQIIIGIKASTIAEAVMVVNIFLDEIEEETRKTLGL